jgi:uncharacterized protein YfdQ (DUF2303 family)
MTDTQTEASTIAELAQRAAQPNELDPDTLYGVIVPLGHDFKTVDLETHLPVPRRKKGTAIFYDADSFAAYVNRHKGAETQIYKSDIGASVPTITAYINDHATEQAGWRDHVAVLELQRTDNWKAWLDSDGKLLPQVEFAELIEAQVDDVREPTGAEMLELAQTFQAKTKVDFQSGTRLADGQQQLLYSENIDASGGKKGELKIPTEFKLGIAPFEGGDAFGVTARLRFRIREGILKLGFVLNKPKDVERSAFADVAASVTEQTEITLLYGSVRR